MNDHEQQIRKLAETVCRAMGLHDDMECWNCGPTDTGLMTLALQSYRLGQEAEREPLSKANELLRAKIDSLEARADMQAVYCEEHKYERDEALREVRKLKDALAWTEAGK